ncbi:formyltetrahydrofolate deformylase [Pontibacillus yanchengensis]|uniref:Formyltetrahydrofolate deformylase n=2 Tax=Pontibacillus yanchengensis TaxID=462910 RepID=A0ACC7VD12_9BACI|nr:formyltetrahydrofolate deformylase [Pontibacillus yanchengensis]MYL32926.1 formyltetrahydrofolate deformylase [Pontibacillus yanchengensis]MYL51834.1 formyltetrahydrofolate deformylase [Pontibacillus yanchengensis]
MSQSIQEQIQTFKQDQQNRGRLLISCPDQPGIVSAISTFLADNNANIMESNQYSTDPKEGTFFMRIEFECPDLPTKEEELKTQFSLIAQTFSMDWKLKSVYDVKRTAIFVSKELHCLRELLFEWQSGDIITEIPLVIGNHEHARQIVESFGIPFYYIPASKENRAEVEEKQLELLKEYNIDVIVLARYMQILTPNFVAAHPSEIINIHHSFLPAFIGANPHKRAHERGVKLIGATSHYVTNELDEGPIIEQDINRVDHRDDVKDLKKIGRSIERTVLARAVKWHLEDRVIVFENKTIVF